MTRRLVFRPLAEADLSDIWDYTATHWSAHQAEAYVLALNDTLTLLCDHPEIGRPLDLRPPVRIFPYRSHLLIYSATDRLIEVIRILHMRSDWITLLAD